MTERFIHDSELPSELCDDLECEDHHPRCSWGGPYCDELGTERVAGRAWCVFHMAQLRDQIAILEGASR